MMDILLVDLQLGLSYTLKFKPEGWLAVFSVSKFHYFLQHNASQSLLNLKWESSLFSRNAKIKLWENFRQERKLWECFPNLYHTQMSCSSDYAKAVSLRYRLKLEMNLIRNISFSKDPSGIQNFLFMLLLYESLESFITNNFLICESPCDLWIVRNNNTVFYGNKEAIKVMMLKSILSAIWEQISAENGAVLIHVEIK